VGARNGEIYNGADDDGSGTVALLEIAQAFQMKKSRKWSQKIYPFSSCYWRRTRLTWFSLLF
jgi:hypothetical protein